MARRTGLLLGYFLDAAPVPDRSYTLILVPCLKPNPWLAVAALILIACGIAALFWRQELQYVRPTPVPPHYVAVLPGQRVVVPAPAGTAPKPVLLHFFNPDCPCSRFNLKHVKRLVTTYENTVSFLAVVPEQFGARTEQIRREYDLSMPVVADGQQ